MNTDAESPNQHGPFGAETAATLEHLNEEHDDTVTFMGRALSGDPDVVSASLTVVDHDGLDFELTLASGERVAWRAQFPNRADTADAAHAEFLNLIIAARQAASVDEPLTSIELELSDVTVIPTHVTAVSAVAEITPRLRQITLHGGLDRFTPLAADQFVYVLAPPRGTGKLTIDESFSWETYESMPEAERPVGAYYTVRRWDPETQSIDLWVVLHGHDGEGEHWGRNAQPGDAVALWGPREAYERPGDTDAVLLVGDETALPAIAAILEQLDAGDRATVIVALDAEAQPIEFGSPAVCDVRWVAAGETALFDAVSALPEGTLTASTYAWGGAESRDVSAVRRYLREVVGLPRDHVSMTGYWRRA